MREYIESIVFYGGEAMEMERLNQLLEEVRACRTRVIVAAAPMVFLVLINAIALYFIPVMMASASAIYLGDTAYGSQFDAFNYGGAVAFFSSIGMQITGLVSACSGLGNFVGLVHRVVAFLEASDKVTTYLEGPGGDPALPPSEGGQLLRVEDLTVDCPANSATIDRNQSAILVESLSLSVRKGEGLMIQGPSGSGKSSLLRVLAGLWTPRAGTVLRPPVMVPSEGGEASAKGCCFFVPQTPYTTEGTLREQLLYPQQVRIRSSAAEDALLAEMLERVGLRYLYARWGLDQPSSWVSHLSGGEMQRLGIARLLIHKPVIALLDESTSALDQDLEARCFEAILGLGITPVTVSHRDTCQRFHQHILSLTHSAGTWEHSTVDL